MDITSKDIPTFVPIKFNKDHKYNIEYGRYIVVRKDGKKHLETFNGSGWAYNHNTIEYYYLPKFD